MYVCTSQLWIRLLILVIYNTGSQHTSADDNTLLARIQISSLNDQALFYPQSPTQKRHRCSHLNRPSCLIIPLLVKLVNKTILIIGPATPAPRCAIAISGDRDIASSAREETGTRGGSDDEHVLRE